MTGSAYLPWGEIERGKIRLIAGAESVQAVGYADSDQAIACGTCLSLLYWPVRGGAYVRVPYGTLVDEPTLKPTAHIFVASKAMWHQILDDLPRHDEYPRS
jgi:hypothetical protein